VWSETCRTGHRTGGEETSGNISKVDIERGKMPKPAVHPSCVGIRYCFLSWRGNSWVGRCGILSWVVNVVVSPAVGVHSPFSKMIDRAWSGVGEEEEEE
jgi:hypothetical protein